MRESSMKENKFHQMELALFLNAIVLSKAIMKI